jgi:hypothetical protein
MQTSQQQSLTCGVSPAVTAKVYKRYYDYDSYGGDIPGMVDIDCPTEDCCQRLCDARAACIAYVWCYEYPDPPYDVLHHCWLKKGPLQLMPLSAGKSWAKKGLMVAVQEGKDALLAFWHELSQGVLHNSCSFWQANSSVKGW